MQTFEDYTLSSKDAQKLLRDIQAELVIPRNIYDENEHLFEQLKIVNKEERARLYREIAKLTVSLRKNRVRGKTSRIPHERIQSNGKKYNLLPWIKILELQYDFDEKSKTGTGVLLDQELDNFI
ncbi:hypothetical protein ACUIAK_12835 [Bacillus cytotoxicus]